MYFKRSLKKLNLFKKEMKKYEHLEDTEISSILKWVKERQKSCTPAETEVRFRSPILMQVSAERCYG